MSVTADGRLVVSCTSRSEPADRREQQSPWERSRTAAEAPAKPYAPTVFPGRVRWQEVHVWDAHGTLVRDDAVPGLAATNGVFMDRDGAIYAMAAATRVLNGDKPYPNE